LWPLLFAVCCVVICWREDRVAVGARAVVAARVVRAAVGQLDPHKVGHHP